MTKTSFLQIRLSPEDRERIDRVAKADHLDSSTWARRAILRAVEDWEEDSRAEDGSRPSRSDFRMPDD